MLRALRRLFLLVAVVTACLAASTADAASVQDDVVARAAGSPDTTSRGLAAGRLAAEWGGPTVAATGETVTIFLSGTYPVDQVLLQKWVDFMASLLHGSELATVTVHIAPLAEVQRFCGGQALACYSGRSHTIYSPGESPETSVTAEGTLAHEYGHHVAASRLNAPFSALDYGTKRWASYENICSGSESGALYPGAEDFEHYSLNPGEAFAESYRVLNEQRLGLPQEPWSIVTTSLYPNATALGLIEQDVVTPWTANTTTNLSAALSAKVRTRTLTLRVPYDGTLSLRAAKSGTAAVNVSILAKRESMGTTTFKGKTSRALTTTVCGQRSVSVRVKLAGTVTKQTKASVSLTVSAP